MTNSKAQIANEIQMAKCQKVAFTLGLFWILNFDIDFTFELCHLKFNFLLSLV